MKKAIIGKKMGMTQIFDESGHVIPVTVIQAGPCVVVQKKTEDNDGYNAVQLGYGDVKDKHLTKPEQGHLKKAGVANCKHLKEFKLESAAEMNVGDVINAERFRLRRPCGRHRHQQGPRLSGRCQAPRRSAHPDDPRRRPCPPSRRFHGLHFQPLPHLQGQDWRRPDGRGAGHRSEPDRGSRSTLS